MRDFALAIYPVLALIAVLGAAYVAARRLPGGRYPHEHLPRDWRE